MALSRNIGVVGAVIELGLNAGVALLEHIVDGLQREVATLLSVPVEALASPCREFGRRGKDERKMSGLGFQGLCQLRSPVIDFNMRFRSELLPWGRPGVV